jgi:hypothetical protein
VTDGRDSLQRRNRLKPTSTGKRVLPQIRDILWFQKLAEHGPLPSSFLLAYSAHSHKSPKRARERLTDLFNEDNTPHGAAYLIRPPQQFRTLDSRYNQLVYDLAPSGLEALKDANGGGPPRTARSGPWLHSFMVSCITASIELACIEREDVSFIPQSAILSRADTELRYPTKVQDSKTGRLYDKDLVPDAIFGLEYHAEGSSQFRFFIIEADRATEPATSKNFNRKSFQRHLVQYQAYIEDGGYKSHLGLSAPMMVLNVTSDAQRLDQLLNLTAKHYPQGNTYQLFQCWSDFGPVFRPPDPNPALLNGDWSRAGLGPTIIGSTT